MKERRKLRVLHCPWNVGCHPGTLSHFERIAGLDSHSVALVRDPFGFPVDEILFDDGEAPVEQDRLRRELLVRALHNFDVVHFNFGQTMLESATIPRLNVDRHLNWRENRRILYQYFSWMADLPILRLANKVIVMTYQGDDARQGDYCRAHFEITAAREVDYYTAESDAWKRRAIRRVARYADQIYSLNPDLIHVLPSGTRFMPYANVDPTEWAPTVVAPSPVPLVLHAPTNRGVKGTRFIVQAVEELRGEGLNFEFVLVENMSREEARRHYQRADLLVDQLLLGWYGGLAVECMALGKPVVCYLRKDDLKFLPAGMAADLPLIDATPLTIKDVLRDLLTRRRGELPELGRRGRSFIERWHDPRGIAEQTARDYRKLAARRRGLGRFRLSVRERI